MGTLRAGGSRTCRTSARFRKYEMIKPKNQIAASEPTVASNTRFKTLARELVPLAPSAARSCKMTWLKMWLRNSHCVVFLASPPEPPIVDVCQPCDCVLVKYTARISVLELDVLGFTGLSEN